jgi:gliding motility-associated-like protein
VPNGARNDSFSLAIDTVTCFGADDGGFTVHLERDTANGPFQYSFNGGAYQDDSTFANLAAGQYTVTVRNKYGCTYDITVNVPQPDQGAVVASPDSIITAPGVQNQATATPIGYTNPVYSWSPVTAVSCNDCPNPMIAVDVNTVIYVTVTEGQQCPSTDSIVVIVNSTLEMPNAFTPNGDGRNDLFQPVSLNGVTVTAFRIYNRWGQLIHDASAGWDGKFKGADQPAGTYLFYISAKVPDQFAGAYREAKQEGSFTLVR